MKIKLLLSLLLWVSLMAAQTDQYGGVTAVVSTKGPGTTFRTDKINDRWLFVTPDGHGMWMRGVFNVNPTTSIDDQGTSYRAVMLSRYGSEAVWAGYTNKRLASWNFNTLAEYESAYTIKTTVAKRLPYIMQLRPAHYALLNNTYAPPVKDIMNGVGPAYHGWRGGTVPDVFDPNFGVWLDSALKATYHADPWMVGIAVDDSDNMFGFGPGPDVPTVPSGHASAHIGWLTLVTSPTQTSNSKLNVSYVDQHVHAKDSLRGFLQSRYAEITDLNTAWGSTYTSFWSDGGTGLMDEDGTHAWVGADSVSLTGETVAMQQDLNDFLYKYAARYFWLVSSMVKQDAPGVLLMGPATLNGWNGVSRQQVLKAAGQFLDVVQASVYSQQVMDLTAQAVGDKPLVAWTGNYANPDSGLWRWPIAGGLLTQADRAAWYQNEVMRDFNMMATGSSIHLVAGTKVWAWTDSQSERRNWGFVSQGDNAYDGVEAVMATSTDVYGFTRGGEEHDYGDFLDTVRAVNQAIDQNIVP